MFYDFVDVIMRTYGVTEHNIMEKIANFLKWAPERAGGGAEGILFNRTFILFIKLYDLNWVIYYINYFIVILQLLIEFHLYCTKDETYLLIATLAVFLYTGLPIAFFF